MNIGLPDVRYGASLPRLSELGQDALGFSPVARVRLGIQTDEVVDNVLD